MIYNNKKVILLKRIIINHNKKVNYNDNKKKKNVLISQEYHKYLNQIEKLQILKIFNNKIVSRVIY